MELQELRHDQMATIKNWRNANLAGMRTSHLITYEMQLDFYQYIICDRSSKHRYWAINYKGVLNGMGGITYISWENSQGELSIILSPQLEDEDGFQQLVFDKAIRMLLDKGFLELNLRFVAAEVYDCNPYRSYWNKLASLWNPQKPSISTLTCRKYWDGQYYDSQYLLFER